MKTNKKNYMFIIAYSLILVLVLLGFNKLYGSNTDWISQHSVIPEYFRSIFYETKNLLPSFNFNLGAGQNIFNYSYYGLLSPIILTSYLLPFLSMTNFIMIASILLYISSGILIYYFLKNNNQNNTTSLILSCCFLTLAPITYHFHHHIMFVWYLPFLILALIGVDKYLNKNKSFLLMISIFLIITTNYYYSISSLIVIVIYGIYKILNKKDLTLKTFFLTVLKSSLRIIIPILMAGIILFPTAYVILKTGRATISNTNLLDLIIPNLNEVLYKAFSMGLTSLFLLAPFGILCSKNKNKSDTFLSISLILITMIPIFMYALNGFLYIRGKVLIPFTVLYIFALTKFLNKLKSQQINLKHFILITIAIMLLAFITNYQNPLGILFYLDILIVIITIKLFQKYKKNNIILIPLMIMLLLITIINNNSEKYVSKNRYQDINKKEITELLNMREKDTYYRTDNYNFPLEVSNKYYDKNYYSTTIYSSNYNNHYWNYYNFESGNNINYRNIFITAGSKNLVFNTMMGVKYIISKDDIGIGYEKIKTINDLSLYYNKNSYPLLYTTTSPGSNKEYQNLEFPYNIEYSLLNPVTNSEKTANYQSTIKEYSLDIKEKYDLELKEKTVYNYKLSKPIKNKILLISFDMNYNQSCNEGDTWISINGINNKLTCESWLYHNKNHKFEYVISNQKQIDNLKIEIGKGKYQISNIKIYTMDYAPATPTPLEDLQIDKKTSTITGSTNLEESGYLITSIPYDGGFEVYIDDQKVEKEIVNTAFLGLKVAEGQHNIKIKYTSPYLILGIIVSILGTISMVGLIIYEKWENKIKKIIKDNKEIIMYLIFGVLTTLVSLLTYYFCTYTILNPNNKIELQIANIISWIISVTFAYITNRKFVFTSKNKKIIQEMFSFYSSRIITLLLDMALMFIFVSCLKYNDTITKLIVQILVIIANYVLSKMLVFKKESNK